METTARTVVKALCWQGLGLATMSGIGWMFTGSVAQGGALALTSAGIGLACYILHERVWARIGWGRLPDGPSGPGAA